MTHRHQYDTVIIGAGNAGFGAAGVLHEAGQRVVMVERDEVGGTCPLRGCVPKKVLVAAAQTLDVIARANEHQIAVGKPELDWPALIARERSFVEGVPAELEASLARRGITLQRGSARFVGPKAVAVGGEILEGRNIVIATGSRPKQLPIAGFEHAITSDDILRRTTLPASLIFVGGGVIGLEFGHVFARGYSRDDPRSRAATAVSLRRGRDHGAQAVELGDRHHHRDRSRDRLHRSRARKFLGPLSQRRDRQIGRSRMRRERGGTRS
jgi:glutathione reductase (NADPH)